jgi:predicted alpha/beta hydrolase family esterase
MRCGFEKGLLSGRPLFGEGSSVRAEAAAGRSRTAAVPPVAALPSIDPAFVTAPLERLPFPGLIIASRDDPYAPHADNERLAGTLGAELSDAGQSGHINADSGHGPWPKGLMRFAGFMKRL